MLITLSELFEQSVEKYSKYFSKTWPTLMVMIVAFLLRYGAGYLGVYLAFSTRLSSRLADFIVLIILLILTIVGFWATINFIKTAQNLDQNQTIEKLKMQFLNTKKYLLPVFFISLINVLLLAIGGVLLFIPAVIFFVWYYFSSYIVILENESGFNTLKASKNLILGRWWAMAWRIAIPKMVFSLMTGFAAKGLIALFVVIFNPSPINYDLAFEFIAGLVAILTFPLFIWQDLTLYYSAKNNPLNLSKKA